MKHSLKTKLTIIITFAVLFTVIFISLTSNFIIEKQYTKYIKKQQEYKKKQIVTVLNQQYIKETESWNVDFIHSIGMSALYDGYIIKVKDINKNTVWDALAHDMRLCQQIMDDVSQRMDKMYPNQKGEITSETYPMTLNGKVIGTVSISYFGPFFLNENDFRFLNALLSVFIFAGVLTIMLSIVIGLFTAKKLANPILKTVEVTKKIAEGNYDASIDETTNTNEINMLIYSINLLAHTLKRQETLRKQLTDDISHELRTPISILQSHLEAMIEEVWPPTKERLESCNEEVKRLSDLINDLEKLAIAENSNIKLKKTLVNINDVIGHAIKAFHVKINEKNIKVTITNKGTDIYADYTRITQVVVNLLSNAIKYTDYNGAIDIKIYETHDYLNFSIQDNGVGIPENELPNIFERFYRTDKSHNRKTGGSGLGLSIVKSIVEEHNGKIEVYSELNKGSTFTVMLPK